MNTLINWLENSFAPKLGKVNNNVWVVAIKDAVMQTLPFIFLASVFSMLTIVADYASWWPDFWVPYGWTMGILSLFVAFLVPFNLMEKKRLRKQRLIAGMSGLALFLIVVSPQVIKDGDPGFGSSALGAGGMFASIIVGLFVGMVMNLLGKFTLFKDESAVPDFVRAWFDAMLPVGIVIVTGWVVVDIAGLDVYSVITKIFMPLQDVIESPYGFAAMGFIVCLLYSMGISTWVLTPVIQPVLLSAIAANVAGTAENLVTGATIYSAYLWIGGIGATLPLVLMMMRSRSKRLKALGRATIVPSLCNINEPTVFAVIAWNPIMMIPMWIQGLVLPLVVWLFTKTIPFAPIPMRQFEMWYTPFPFATWLTTGAVSGLILMVGIFALASAIWYPFFKAYEKQTVASEAEAEAQAPATATV